MGGPGMLETHRLTQNEDTTWTCEICRWTWKHRPESSCPGVPQYMYGAWPASLYTYTQLRRMKLKPVAGVV